MPAKKPKFERACVNCGNLMSLSLWQIVGGQKCCSQKCASEYRKGVPNIKNSKPKVKKICLHCGKDFFVHPYRAEISNYCSKSCGSTRSGEKASRWGGGKIKKNCEYCGQAYKIWNFEKDISHYCSRSCTSKASNSGEKSYLWKGGKGIKTCTQCGKEFIEYAHDSNQKFCSTNCHDKWRSINKSGSNSHAWQGGISFEPYPFTFNQEFKRLIRERDNYTCAICGEYGKAIHHINYIKLDTVPENCVTLCNVCHGKTNSNREHWIEYFSMKTPD